MLELACLEQIVSEEETYVLHVKVPKSAYLAWKMAFEALEDIAKDVHYKHRLAEERSEKRREEWEAERREKIRQILSQIRNFYYVNLENGIHPKETMKEITKKWKDYRLERDEFKEELRSKRDLEVIKYHQAGLNSIQIAGKTGIPSPTIRKVILLYQKNSV